MTRSAIDAIRAVNSAENQWMVEARVDRLDTLLADATIWGSTAV